MTRPFTLKTDDTRTLDVTPLADGAPIDVPAGTTAVFSMINLDTQAVIISRAAAVVLQTSPLKLRYQWQAAQTAEGAPYGCEFRVAPPGGGIMTFPSEGLYPIKITPDI